MKNFLNLIFIVFFFSSSFSQEKNLNKRINFLILIDNEISGLNISDGKFIIKDSLNVNIDTICFDYHVGDLSITESDYNKFKNLPSKVKMVIKFKLKIFAPEYKEIIYECTFPVGWINDEYMMMKIYNKNKKNKKTFYFKDKDYLSQFSIPSLSQILIKKR